MKPAAANIILPFHAVSLAFIILIAWCCFTADAFTSKCAMAMMGRLAPQTTETTAYVATTSYDEGDETESGGLGLTPPPSSTLICEASKSRNEPSPSTGSSRREILQNSFSIYLASVMMPSSAFASNLPDSTGADLSKTGSIDTLIPIVAIQSSLLSAKLQLSDPKNGSPSSIATPEICATILQSLLKCIPREEKAFKRIFDAYSTPVSYKQKFLDQNAFLVYYTKGYDGPGRPNIEEDTNSVQTLQYGSRNDAWNAMDDLFVELEFGKGSKDVSALSDQGELVALVDKVLGALDSYISLAPVADVDEARRQLGQ